jgi:uncharacterized protein GlcG (DUF336 family)
MYQKKVIKLETALKGMEAMLQAASKDPDRPMAIAIVDNRGEMVCFARQDGCQLHRNKMAFRKAYTAAHMRRSVRELDKLLKAEDFDISMFGPEYTTIPGGEPVFDPRDESKGTGESPREVIGAIGTSGRLSAEDEEIALIGVKVLQDILWPE